MIPDSVDQMLAGMSLLQDQCPIACALIFFFQFQICYCHRITKFPNKLYNSSVSCDNEDWTHKSMCPLSMCPLSIKLQVLYMYGKPF